MTVAEFQDALLKLSPKDGDVVFYDLNAINSDWFDSDGFRASMQSLPGAPRFLLFPVSIPRGASFEEAIRLGPQWLKCDGRTLTVDGVRVSRELFKFWHDDANAGKLFRLVTAGEVPTLTVERRPESELQKNAPPKHPFELTIRIGGNDFDYVKRTAQDIATHIAECGENCSLASGGWGGCHSVDIEKRDITPEAYRAELEAWSSAK
jgi:hypothetical protein